MVSAYTEGRVYRSTTRLLLQFLSERPSGCLLGAIPKTVRMVSWMICRLVV